MNTHRLVTIVGAGGIGKTRLAQAVAYEQRSHFPDGAWMIDLAPVADPERLPVAVAQALGAMLSGCKRPVDEVIDGLRSRRLLPVLDNCEHLLDAASTFAQAVHAQARDVHLLVTS